MFFWGESLFYALWGKLWCPLSVFVNVAYYALFSVKLRFVAKNVYIFLILCMFSISLRQIKLNLYDD